MNKEMTRFIIRPSNSPKQLQLIEEVTIDKDSEHHIWIDGSIVSKERTPRLTKDQYYNDRETVIKEAQQRIDTLKQQTNRLTANIKNILVD